MTIGLIARHHDTSGHREDEAREVKEFSQEEKNTKEKATQSNGDYQNQAKSTLNLKKQNFK